MRIRLMLMMGLVMAMVLAACGGGDGGDDGDDGGGGGAASSSISVTATEFVFDPDAYVVDAGASISFQMTNEGSVEHNWVLLTAGTNVTEEAEVPADNTIIEFTSNAGESVTGTFTAPAAGTYQVVCTIAGHLAAGMEGQLVVSG